MSNYDNDDDEDSLGDDIMIFDIKAIINGISEILASTNLTDSEIIQLSAIIEKKIEQREAVIDKLQKERITRVNLERAKKGQN
jgi:hypothetical protein